MMETQWQDTRQQEKMHKKLENQQITRDNQTLTKKRKSFDKQMRG